MARKLEFLADDADLSGELFFFGPLFVEFFEFGFGICTLLFDLVEPLVMFGTGDLFAFECLILFAEPLEPAGEVFDGGGG